MPLSPVGSSGGGLTSPVGLADGGTGQATAAAARFALGVDQGWQAFPHLYAVTLDDEADSITNPPTCPVTANAFVWAQSATLDSASVTSDVLSLDFDATSSTFAGGARMTTTLPPCPGKRRAVVCFVSSADLDANTEAGGVVLETATATNSVGALVRSSGGNWQVQVLTDAGSVATVNITEGDVTGGVWLMLWQENEAGAGVVTGAAYVLGGSSGTEPAIDDWEMIHTGLVGDGGNAFDDLLAGIVGKTANTNDTLTAAYEGLRVGYV